MRTEDDFKAVGVIPELYIESKSKNKLNFIMEAKGAILLQLSAACPCKVHRWQIIRE